MARVERFTSKEQIPVQQAQLIDPGAFRFSTAGTEALKAIGGVLEELGKRKRDAQDRIGITDANAIMDNAEREYAKRIIGKPLVEHEAIRLDELNKARAKVSQLNLSPDAREIVNSNANIKADRFSDIAELVNIQATNKDALIKTSEAYETALIEKDVDSITEAEVLLDEQLKNMPVAEAAKFKEELEQQAQMDLAAINPNLVKTAIDTELKARAKGKKPSPEFALLSNTDLEAVRDYANSVGEKAKSESKIASSAAVENAYAGIIGGDTDIAAMITSIQADPAISSEDSNTAAVKIRSFFSTWNSSADKKIVTSDSMRIKALRLKSGIVNGAITLDEALARYKKFKETEKVEIADNKGFINDFFAADKSAKEVKKQRQNTILNKREKQLRDAIEKQPNLLDPDEATEILKDFANIAVIELNNSFPTDSEFTDDEVKNEVDTLIRKYTLSEVQQTRATLTRQLRLAESLQAQQESLTKIVESLRSQGRTDEAKEIMDEALTLGIFESDGKTITKKRSKKKINISKGLWDRLREQFE